MKSFVFLSVLMTLHAICHAQTTKPATNTTRMTTPQGGCLENRCVGQPDGTKVSNPDDCTKYDVCVGDEVASTVDCPSGYYFNGTACVIETETCVNACEPTSPTTSTTPVPSTSPPQICRTECDDEVLYIPHTYNCSVYYQCGPTNVRRQCEEPNPYFDGTACVDDPDLCCDACVPYCYEEDVGQQVADPNDCRAFYGCTEEGIPEPHGYCDAGQVFYSNQGKCVNGPEGCQNYCGYSTEPSTSINFTYSSGATLPSTTQMPIPSDCNDSPVKCVGIPDGELVPDIYDCHKYYKCQSDTPSLIFTCDPGQYFNGTNCVEECDTCTCIPQCIILCPSECPLSSNTLLADPNNCSVYHICTSGELTGQPQSCSLSLPYFDGSTCTNDPHTCCDLCVPYCNEDDLGTSIPDPNDCTSYYNCMFEGAQTNQNNCPEGQYYDEEFGRCTAGSCTNLCS